jgi:hypothetical protein
MRGLREGWLRHSGDMQLTRHALNAVAALLPGGDAVFDRPSKSREGTENQQNMRVIDALKAASMVNVVADANMGSSDEPMIAFV